MKAEARAQYAELAGRALRAFPWSMLLLASGAFACPFCQTETGHQVRAGIFDSSFGMKLLLTAAPFPVFAGVIAYIYLGKPRAVAADGKKSENAGNASQ